MKLGFHYEKIRTFNKKNKVVSFNYFIIKDLKGISKDAGNDLVVKVQLHIALLCINSNISLRQR